MKGTSCQKAIQNWVEKTGQNPAEAEHVKLISQMPPIDRLDESLNMLEKCQHLALSTNSIDKMMPLPKLKNLRILSLGRNQISRILGLEEIGGTLEQLWLSYNQIVKLDGLQPCVRLHTLFISNNKIKIWDEVSKLAQLPELKNVLLVGNTIYENIPKENAQYRAIRRVPQIQVIDGKMVGEAMRKKAEESNE